MALSYEEQLEILVKRLIMYKYDVDPNEKQRLYRLIKRGEIKIKDEEEKN